MYGVDRSVHFIKVSPSRSVKTNGGLEDGSSLDGDGVDRSVQFIKKSESVIRGGGSKKNPHTASTALAVRL